MTSITPERLSTLFRPRSVALVGAANKSMFSNLAYRNLVEFGFAEHTYLVNRRGAETHGRPTVTSCARSARGRRRVDDGPAGRDAGGAVGRRRRRDPQRRRPVRRLRRGGEAGRAAQAELVAHAESLDMVLLGPNMLGFANFVDRIPVTAIPGLPTQHGPVALLSQSGASSSAMLDFASMMGIGMSYMVTLGNEAMITVGHALDFLVDDERTRAVAVFMETVRDRRRSLGRRAAPPTGAWRSWSSRPAAASSPPARPWPTPARWSATPRRSAPCSTTSA